MKLVAGHLYFTSSTATTNSDLGYASAYGSQSGGYVKVGKLVFLYWNLYGLIHLGHTLMVSVVEILAISFKLATYLSALTI